MQVANVFGKTLFHLSLAVSLVCIEKSMAIVWPHCIMINPIIIIIVMSAAFYESYIFL